MFGGDTSRPLPPLDLAAATRWLARLCAHPHAWVVEHEGGLIGEVRLDSMNETDQRARLAIGIFDHGKLGRGIGQEVIRLVLRHAFDDLRLHRVDLRVLAYNVRGIRCYKRCGFVEEGRERESALVDGERHDDVIMGILAQDYRALTSGSPSSVA
jgi:RimJ/RimL family protein N-acetyltransferase